MLLEPDKLLRKALANDLTAGDPHHNQREVLLRERLDLPGLEALLRASAEAASVMLTQVISTVSFGTPAMTLRTLEPATATWLPSRSS